MLKLRALSFSLLFGAATLLTGCFDDVEPPRIKNLAVNPSSVTTAGSQIQGTVEFDTDKATASFRVTRSGADATSDFVFSASSNLSSSPASLGTIKPNGVISDGSYTLTVTVTDDEGNSTPASVGFTVGSTVVMYDDLTSNGRVNVFTMGAQGASAGSFLDVNDFTQYSSDNATHTKTATEKSSIDVVFFANGSTLMLYSPRAAANAGLGGISTWGDININNTIIVDAGTSPVTTSEMAMNLTSGKTSQSAPALEGHVYALKLSTDNYASLTINSVDGSGNTATASVTILSE